MAPALPQSADNPYWRFGDTWDGRSALAGAQPREARQWGSAGAISGPPHMKEERVAPSTQTRAAQMIPGEYLLGDGDIEANAGRRTVQVTVANTADRPIQVGSHFHFFEANRALRFDRGKAFGMRLNVPAGTAVRFEPGDEKVVTLVELAGAREVYGLNALTEGPWAPRAGPRA